MACVETLKPEAYPLVSTLMLGPNDLDSFTWQMDHVRKDAQPTLYLFTAFSAIPVADAVRGYHTAKGEATPAVSFIRADRSVSHAHTKTSAARASARLEQEVERLTPIVEPHTSVCIVDQYRNTSYTMAFAGRILRACGVETISTINGQWYAQADRRDLNRRDMTSIHRDFMHDLGIQAAETDITMSVSTTQFLPVNSVVYTY